MPKAKRQAKPARRAALKSPPKASVRSAKASARSSAAPSPSAVRKRLRALARDPWKCEVDIYLQPQGSDPPFELQTCLEMNSAKRIIFKNRRRPGFIIRFRLHDDLNPGYHFPSDPTQAVWSQAGPDCPQAQAWEVFEPVAVEDSGMTLVVYNENPKPAIGNFKYSLRVTRGNGPPFLLLDPGGTDSKGGNK